jgi:lycopene cyclase domain-containing protein
LKAAVLAITTMAVPFLVWDHFVTDLWWSFNPTYTLGWKIGKLPVEEVLFFFIIPWSCLVMWVNIRQRFAGEMRSAGQFILPLIAFLLGGWGLYTQYWYSFAAGVVLLVVLGLQRLLHRDLLSSREMVLFLLFVTATTTIFNGFLTARPIVSYDPQFLSGMRVLTIPLEDYLYGFALTIGTIVLYEKWSTRS